MGFAGVNIDTAKRKPAVGAKGGKSGGEWLWGLPIRG